MADLNALIAQGAQFNLPNPVDQYSKVMQLQSAQQQMQLNRQQMQQIQEDRAGFAKLREKLADQNLTPEQYESALTQAPDPNLQKMGIELRMRRTRLDELDKALGGGVKPAAEAPMAAPVEAPMAAPVAPKREMFVTKDSSGRSRYLVDGAEVSPQEYQSAQSGVVVGAAPAATPVKFELPAFEPTNALAAQVAPAAAVAEAPVVNAMASKQAQLAEISKKLAVLTSPRYADLAGVKDQITYLREEQKRLSESAFAKPDISNFTPASVAKYGQTGNPGDLVAVGKEGTKSELARLMSERAALIASGAALTDNRVVAYDNAITKASAPSAGQPSDVTQLIAERNAAVIANRPADEIAALNAAIKKATTPAQGSTVNVNAFTPASVEAQKQFVQTATDERKALRNAPDTIKNIEAAKKLIPSASTFMGTGGEPLLAAASFLNNRLGFGISTKGVTDATVLRTRLFEGILDNLKKLDSQPSQEQQRVLAEALGNLGTDPAALEQILDRIGETVRDRVDRFNTDVTEAETRGVKFPFKPQIGMPARKLKPEDAAAQIPTGKAAATGGNVVTLPDGRTKTFPTAEAAAQFKKAAGL
jgi:hypothetical protein